MNLFTFAPVSVGLGTVGIFVAAIVVLFVVLKLFKVSVKIILRLVVNAVIGGLALYLLNYIPGVNMPLNVWTALASGVFGIPAVIVIFIISLF